MAGHRVKNSRKKRRIRKTRRARIKLSGGSEANTKYVSSRGILKACDVIPKDIVSGIVTSSVDISAIKNGSVVYVHGSSVPDFLKKLNEIQGKFVLVSGDCDHSIPETAFGSDAEFNNFINSDKVLHWFSQNLVKNHPKLTHIPIGLAYHVTDSPPAEQERMLIDIKNGAKPLNQRKPMCYANFQFSKPPSNKYAYDRDDAIKGVPKELVFYEPQRMERLDTWKNQTEYAFVISPHGNGLDCHRTWEALVLGCIPIVKTSPIDPVFQGLPVLIVKDWPDVTSDLLAKTMGKYSIDDEKLTLKYWMNLIRSKSILHK